MNLANQPLRIRTLNDSDSDIDATEATVLLTTNGPDSGIDTPVSMVSPIVNIKAAESLSCGASYLNGPYSGIDAPESVVPPIVAI